MSFQPEVTPDGRSELQISNALVGPVAIGDISPTPWGHPCVTISDTFA